VNIDLCLISHTNVGKTSLARTLLRRDIGQALDQAHVTDTAEAHELIASAAGDALLLWDTPGLGDSARLLKRLSRSADPVGWLMTQAWDRWVDRPLYCSQMAIRAVREHCDVVLYLVNASEGPASSGYVDIEMQIMGWMGKPVLVLLNQVGPPRADDSDRRDEQAWRAHLGGYPWVKDVLSLDAFTRVWIQENELLLRVQACLPLPEQSAMEPLRAEWQRRNLEVFDASMACIARQLALNAFDSEPMAARGWTQDLRAWLAAMPLRRDPDSTPPAVAGAMNALAKRADDAVRACTQQLIRLHGLGGHAAGDIEARLAAHFSVNESVNPAKVGLLGAVLTGALGGLAADLAAGGFTFGAGAIVGGVLGLLGGSGAAKAYNLARRSGEDRVSWSPDFLLQRAESAVLRYLAVAHFGRGRGSWTESEYPPHWPAMVHAVAAPYGERLRSAWRDAPASDPRHASRDVERCVTNLQPLLQSLVTAVLIKLYPHADALLVRKASQ
jgi:hypothetical protein